MASSPPFVWPPRPDATVGDDTVVPALAPMPVEGSTRVTRTGEDVWRSVERAWLAPVREPLARRIADLRWAPDRSESYCDRCGATVGPHEDHEFGCGVCAHRRFRWERIVRLGEFRADLRDWVLEAKFEASHAMALALGRVLGVQLRGAGVRADAVVPVPVDPVRRFLRGIDHTAWLARGVSRELGVPVRRLLRARRGPSQRAVAPSAREQNVRGRFVPRGQWHGGPGGRGSVSAAVLVDDVLTTGATMRAAVRALAGPGRPPMRVWCGVVGVTPDPGRVWGRVEGDRSGEETWETGGGRLEMGGLRMGGGGCKDVG